MLAAHHDDDDIWSGVETYKNLVIIKLIGKLYPSLLL